MGHNALDAILILLVASVVAVAAFRRFHLPPILAYLFVGILIGPHGLGWIPDSADTRILAGEVSRRRCTRRRGWRIVGGIRGFWKDKLPRHIRIVKLNDLWLDPATNWNRERVR